MAFERSISVRDYKISDAMPLDYSRGAQKTLKAKYIIYVSQRQRHQHSPQHKG